MINLFDTLAPAGRFPVTGAEHVSVNQGFDSLQDLLDYLLSELQTINDKIASGGLPIDPPTDPEAAIAVGDINDMLVEYFETKTVSEVEA